jgi:choline dehydrogenase-like flavoprotein
LHANACNLIMAEDGETVISVRCQTFTGKETHFSADRFVLCLGGIESSRFLLQPYAAGVAPWNRSGLVGRHFQDHIHYYAGDIVHAKLDDKNRHYGPERVHLHNYEYHPKIKLSPAAQERYGVLNVGGLAGYDDGGIYPTRVAALLIAGPASAITFRDLALAVPRGPAFLWNRFQTKIKSDIDLRWGKLKLSVYCEQSPLSQSRITLSDRRDALGLFQTRIDWRVSKQEIETIRRYVQVALPAFAQRGLRIEPDPDLFKDGLERKFTDFYHHMGGTRMATSVSEGVVDVNLRLYGTRNAYVCSSSVFPSSGFANPTHTLLALAVRLAWHLKDLPAIQRGVKR